MNGYIPSKHQLLIADVFLEDVGRINAGLEAGNKELKLLLIISAFEVFLGSSFKLWNEVSIDNRLYIRYAVHFQKISPS